MLPVTALLSRLTWANVVDILLVALVFYGIFSLAQGTRAVQLIRGIIVLLIASVILVSVFQLTTLNWLIRNSIPALLVAISVIFQPELRRFLQQIGHTSEWFSLPLGNQHQSSVLHTIDEITEACADLSRRRVGALVVMERETGLQDIAEAGVYVDAVASSELIVNLFVPNSPLHDGAVIIRRDRVLAASCVLPLTDNILQHQQLGTRHRAALGVSEVSDAVAIVVSEQTGDISVASSGKLARNLSVDRLRIVLIGLARIEAEAVSEGKTDK